MASLKDGGSDIASFGKQRKPKIYPAEYVKYLQERLKNWNIAFNEFDAWKKRQLDK